MLKKENYNNKYFVLFLTAPNSKSEVDEKGLTNILHESGIYSLSGKLLSNFLRVDGVKGDLVRSEPRKSLSLFSRIKVILQAMVSGNIYIFSSYAGTWFGQFGHFITETITRFDENTIKKSKNFIFHSLDLDKKNHKILSYQKNLLEILEIDYRKVKILTNKPAVLLLSSTLKSNVILNQEATLDAVKIWQKASLAANVKKHKKNIFVSRGKLDPSRLKIPIQLNKQIEEYFIYRNFEIVYPEMLTIYEQLNFISNANVIAGLMGSGLHLSVFASEHATIVEIGDKESPDLGNPHQHALISACNQKHVFIKYFTNLESIDWENLDLFFDKYLV